ncbi:MAG: citrate synthase [Candidatus Kariarchaeaceae archaeon]|jgi:citrate synthase
MADETAKLTLKGTDYEFPVVVGSEGEVGVDFTTLRPTTGAITFDPAYGNTGSCTSKITFINGEKGILRYRGYPIEDLAAKCTFLEICYLVIYGELPDKATLEKFDNDIRNHTLIHEDMKKFFEGFPKDAHPMTVLTSMVASLDAFYPKASDKDARDENIIRLLAKLPTLAAFAFKKSIGQAFMYPKNKLDYVENFLHMAFATKTEKYEVSPVIAKALNVLLILHADHEQNCSASTVKMVGSSQANLFGSIAAGVSALSGPLHGGANAAVLNMLDAIVEDGGDYDKYMGLAKDKTSGFKLMGFGHRVYKNFDPRATILKAEADKVLAELKMQDPLLDIAKNLEKIALEDDFFVQRKLYPNVDFYSGIIYRALGFPVPMFTVLFALGRLPGWIAQWMETVDQPGARIFRPRQIYNGYTKRDFKPLDQR